MEVTQSVSEPQCLQDISRQLYGRLSDTAVACSSDRGDDASLTATENALRTSHNDAVDQALEVIAEVQARFGALPDIADEPAELREKLSVFVHLLEACVADLRWR